MSARRGHTRGIDPQRPASQGPSVADGQGELPLGLPGRRWQPGRIAATTAAFLARWVLRLALPLGGAAAMLHLFPYHATAGGVRFQIQATLFKQPGITADTTFGSWVFDHVDGLPVGLHVRPENVDVVRMSAAATKDPQAYVDRLRDDFVAQIPPALTWIAGEALIGVLLGLLAAVSVNLAVRQLRGLPRRRSELRHRARQLVAVVAIAAAVGSYGAVSYDPNWTKRSHLTGTLAALQLFPGQLRAYYEQNATAFGVLGGITAIQAQLQRKIDAADVPDTAFNIMFISDMHLASTYPLLREYARNFDVSLVVNTGDESNFGTTAEMTPEYLAQLRSLTDVVPMIWVAGNHDSPETAGVMRSVQGVTVLGTKSASADGDGFDVTGEQIDAYGLTIAAVPDPRVYGAAGAFGSDTPSVVDPLERRAMDGALAAVPRGQRYDIVATHEPVAAQRAAADLRGRIRQINSGHLHHQNPGGEIQHGSGPIDLVEGSSGAGGLKELGLDVKRVPIEFSIESVSPGCQFTKVVRFQVAGPGPTSPGTIEDPAQNVTASTIYLKTQDVPAGADCDTTRGFGPVSPVAGPAG